MALTSWNLRAVWDKLRPQCYKDQLKCTHQPRKRAEMPLTDVWRRNDRMKRRSRGSKAGSAGRTVKINRVRDNIPLWVNYFVMTEKKMVTQLMIFITHDWFPVSETAVKQYLLR